jgi:hypothetical protein
MGSMNNRWGEVNEVNKQRWDEAKTAVMERASEPCKYKFSLDTNPDTHLLAEMLRAEFKDVMDADVGVDLDAESRAKLAWYRVAERAKELRA